MLKLMLLGAVIGVALIGCGVVEAAGDNEVVNLRGGLGGQCPNVEIGGFLCEDTNGDGTLDTPVECRTGFNYTVPAGKTYQVTDIMNTGTARVDIWTDVRGVVLRSVGNEKVPLQNPLVFQPGEKICPADGTTGANSVVITGTLKSTSSGVVNMPMTSQVGLAMLTLVLGVLIGRRLRMSWV